MGERDKEKGRVLRCERRFARPFENHATLSCDSPLALPLALLVKQKLTSRLFVASILSGSNLVAPDLGNQTMRLPPTATVSVKFPLGPIVRGDHYDHQRQKG